jgi:ABC-2 type transport system permease protein
MHYLQMYQIFLRLRFKTLMIYRLDFFIGSLATVVLQAASFFAVVFILQRTSLLTNWTLTEIELLYGCMLLALSLNQMFADNLWAMTSLIRSGKLDNYLVKPLNPLFCLLAERFNHVGIGDFISGITLVVHAITQLPQLQTITVALAIFCIILAGGLIFFALNLIASLSAFFMLDAVTITRVVFEMHHFARYPLSIFPPMISFILTWLIPYGFASPLPIAGLLHKTDLSMVFFSPIMAFILVTFGLLAWNRTLYRYNGAGS